MEGGREKVGREGEGELDEFQKVKWQRKGM